MERWYRCLGLRPEEPDADEEPSLDPSRPSYDSSTGVYSSESSSTLWACFPFPDEGLGAAGSNPNGEFDEVNEATRGLLSLLGVPTVLVPGPPSGPSKLGLRSFRSKG